MPAPLTSSLTICVWRAATPLTDLADTTHRLAMATTGFSMRGSCFFSAPLPWPWGAGGWGAPPAADAAALAVPAASAAFALAAWGREQAQDDDTVR